MVDLHSMLWEEITRAYPEIQDLDLDPEEIFPEEIYLGVEELAIIFSKIEEKGVDIKVLGSEKLTSVIWAWHSKRLHEWLFEPEDFVREIALTNDDAQVIAEEVLDLMN